MPSDRAPRTRPGGALATLLAIAVALSSAVALAQPTTEERAAAEVLFQEGRKLALDKKLDEACGKFAESQRLDPHVGTLMYLATCHAEQGKTATAWVEFSDAAGLAQRQGQREREAQARARAAELESKLSRLQIQVTAAPPDLKVRLNQREIRDLSAPFPFDPGPLTIEASAPGRVPWKKTIEVQPGPSTQTVVVPALAPLPPEAPVVVAPKPVQPLETGLTPAERRNRWIAAGALGGVGVVGVVVGSVTGALALSKAHAAQTSGHCMGLTTNCDASGTSMVDSAYGLAYASTAGFALGGAALLAGTIVAVTIPRPSAPPASSAALRVGVGPGGTVTVGGAF
jgi:hypothetical protein